MTEVISVKFKDNGKPYFFDPAGHTVKEGDVVVVEMQSGKELGRVSEGNHSVKDEDIVKPLCKMLRIATEKDLKKVKENAQKEEEALKVCEKMVEQHELDMKLVRAEYSFDCSRIVFFFTSDGRVDFRELVKDLAAHFHTRIELRQIGVRDETKIRGGIGICGRPLCCHTYLTEFAPVSIKMAKEQGLSLSPTKISGTCGRLMCCLKYEQDAYEDLLRTAPKAESFVDTPEGRGTVVEVDLLRQRVKVRMEEHPEEIQVFSNTEIAVLRNGKAKKNDPPVPTDWAPISGSGKRVRRDPEEEQLKLDPIRFRYSTEAVVDEPQEVKEEPAQENRENKSRRSRRKRISKVTGIFISASSMPTPIFPTDLVPWRKPSPMPGR